MTNPEPNLLNLSVFAHLLQSKSDDFNDPEDTVFVSLTQSDSSLLAIAMLALEQTPYYVLLKDEIRAFATKMADLIETQKEVDLEP